MKIAILISGRATQYENCLLKILNNITEHSVDLFMSINDEHCNYYDILKIKLKKWLKNIYINKYEIPDNFINTNTHEQCVKQFVNNKWLPINVLSMYFNYKNAFDMACNYEYDNNLKYDMFMTFRSDIVINKMPIFEKIDENILYSINQPCQFKSFGIHKVPIISPEWVFGTKNIMKKYCDTYNYILDTNKKDSNYIMHYESNCTDNCISKNMKIKRISGIKYDVHKNRRMFDENWKNDGIIKDSRIYNIQNRTIDYININEYI